MALALIAEFGIMFYKYTTLTTTVQDAARYVGERAIRATGLTEIRPEDVTAASNLIVYGNTVGTGTALIDGLDISDVTISCLNGATATSTGTRCASDLLNPSLSQISVNAQIQYSPVLGDMLNKLTGVNVAFPLSATAIHTSS